MISLILPGTSLSPNSKKILLSFLDVVKTANCRFCTLWHLCLNTWDGMFQAGTSVILSAMSSNACLKSSPTGLVFHRSFATCFFGTSRIRINSCNLLKSNNPWYGSSSIISTHLWNIGGHAGLFKNPLIFNDLQIASIIVTSILPSEGWAYHLNSICHIHAFFIIRIDVLQGANNSLEGKHPPVMHWPVT